MKRLGAILFAVLTLLMSPLQAAAQGEARQNERPAAALMAAGVELTPPSAEKWERPDTVAAYTMTIHNSGDDADSYDIAIAGNAWNSWLSASSVAGLAAGASAAFTVFVAVPASANTGDSDTVTVTVTSTTAPNPSASAQLTTRAVPPTATPPAAVTRPLVVVQSYSTGKDSLTAGQEFTLSINLANLGQGAASNVLAAFESSDFLPRDTGGVQAVANLSAGTNINLSQPMLASRDLIGKSVGTITTRLSYLDSAGASYSETFTLTINLKSASYSGPARPTATPTTAPRPKLIINGYKTDVDPLQPGTVFNLELDVQNQGNTEARGITMVLGGSSSGGAEAGTPQPSGGVQGGSSSLDNFAPLDRSNVVFLGDLAAGGSLVASQKLIVNVNTQPGAYPLKISFVYNDARGSSVVDDQVITLLVYALPNIEVSFYREPGAFFANQPNPLPLQVTNLGRKAVVLGNMKISAQGAEIQNGVSLVGALEPGGYFTLDAEAIPTQTGTLELEISINYTDDFNQARTIIQKLPIEVQEMPTPSPEEMGMINGAEQPGTSETFWQKIVRFFKGLFGLDSAPETAPSGPLPVEPQPGMPLPPG